MFARIRYTWSIMGASLEVLKQDKELLLFPLLSSISCLLVLASFAIPLVMTGAWQPPEGAAGAAQKALYYGVLFLFYFANYFVITFFNAAIVSSAVTRLGGGDPSFGDGLRAATARLPQILGWALLAATVGLVLRIVGDRSERVGRFVAGLLGAAWSLVTFLVVPVLVVERKGPIDALHKSAALLRKTWGDQIIGSAGFGLIFTLLALPVIVLAGLGFLGGAVVGGVIAACALVYLIVLALVQSTLQTIYEAAVYLYAERGEAPAVFGKELMAGAMARR